MRTLAATTLPAWFEFVFHICGGWGKAWPRERRKRINRDAGQAMPRCFEPGHRLAAGLLRASESYLASL